MRTNDHKMSVATIVLILRQHFKYKLEHRFYLGCDINWFCPRSAIKVINYELLIYRPQVHLIYCRYKHDFIWK
jgi:hypothetical protein